MVEIEKEGRIKEEKGVIGNRKRDRKIDKENEEMKEDGEIKGRIEVEGENGKKIEELMIDRKGKRLLIIIREEDRE